MTDHEDFADSQFAPLDDVRAGLRALIKDEMNKPPEPWPLGYNKNGIPITLIPPSLYDAALEQNPDADMSMYRRHELPKVGEMQGMVIHKSRSLGPSVLIMREQVADALTKHRMEATDAAAFRAMAAAGQSIAPPLHTPHRLHIYMRPSYPWFHASGYAAGRAALTPAPRPRTALALAIGTMLAAPTLTNQA